MEQIRIIVPEGYYEVRERIRTLLAGEKPRIIAAIDGRCGSGKTTLAAWLMDQFDGNLFHMDDFYLRSEQRTPERLAETGGNVDYERFRRRWLPAGKSCTADLTALRFPWRSRYCFRRKG